LTCFKDCADQVDHSDVAFADFQKFLDLLEQEGPLDELVFIELAQEASPLKANLVVATQHGISQSLDCLSHDPFRNTGDFQLADEVSIVVATQEVVLLNLSQ
jgi:hypothetical protein